MKTFLRILAVPFWIAALPFILLWTLANAGRELFRNQRDDWDKWR